MENLSFEIRAELRNLNKSLDKASTNIESFSKKNEARFKKFGESAKRVGKQLTIGLSAPLALLAGNAVRTFATFDDQMRKVGATSGATEAQLKQLTDTAKQLGQTTRFSAREAGKGLEFMALAGYDTEQSISAIPDVLNLAAAAAIELGTAADIVTDTMSAFGIEAEKAGLVSDVFAKTQSSANTSVLQLGEAFKLSSANASSFGTDLETASSILGKFADSGIKGSQAGTTFNGILRDLKGAAEDGSVAINGQNVALADSEGNFRDILDIMQDVEGATKDLTEMQKSQALEAIFQQQSIRGVNILMQQGVGASKDLRAELYKAGGTAKQMAEQMEGGLGGAMRNLNSAFEGFSIEIGQVLAPLIQKLAGFLGKLLNYFNELSPTTKKIIVAIGGLVAVAGPLLVALGGIATVLPAILSGLALLTGPIGLIVAGIAALTAVVVANWDTISKWAEDIANYFINLYNESIVFRAGVERVIFQLKTLFEVGKFIFNALWTIIKTNFGLIINVLKSFGTVMEGVLTFKFSKVKQGLKDFAKGVEGTVGTAIAELSMQAKELFENVSQNGKEAIDNILSGKKEPVTFDVSEESKTNLKNEVAESVEKGVKEGFGRAQISAVGGGLQSQGINQEIQQPNAPLIPENLTDPLRRINEDLVIFNEEASRIISGGIANTFARLGDAIGNGLVNGGNVFQALGQVLLSSIGEIAVQLGKQAIAIGVGMIAIKKAFSNPFTAIAAGVALVAIGSAISNTANTVGQVGGGGVSSSTGASAGSDVGGRSSVTSTIQNREIILRARGRDLVAVLNNERNFGNIVG